MQQDEMATVPDRFIAALQNSQTQKVCSSDLTGLSSSTPCSADSTHRCFTAMSQERTAAAKALLNALQHGAVTFDSRLARVLTDLTSDPNLILAQLAMQGLHTLLQQAPPKLDLT